MPSTAASEPRPLGVLLAEVAAWVDSPATEVSGGAKAERVLALDAAIDQLRLAQVQTLGAFDADVAWASDGARSASAWVATRGRVSRGRAGYLFARSRELREAEPVEAAWRSERIGEEVAFALLRARNVHRRVFDEQVNELLAWLEGLRVDHALTAIRHWMSIAENTSRAEAAEGADGNGDPDDAEQPDPAADNRVGFHQSFQGRWSLDGDFDAVTGAEIDEQVKAWIDRQFQTGTYRADDGLLYSQRVAAAFAALIQRGAPEGQTRQGAPRPSVSLHLDGRTLAGQPCDSVADAMSRRCNLADGTPVPRATVDRLLCTCRLTPTLERLGPLGDVEVIGITELQRDATAHQRKALAVRDGGCAFPGCDAPPEWCDAHHLLPWEDGGTTLLSNLVLACKHHHHLLHEGGWTLWRASDEQLYLTRPDGTPVPVVPHGQQVPVDAPTPVPPSPAPRRPGELRFLTPRERAVLVAERERRRRALEARRHLQAAPDAPPDTPPVAPAVGPAPPPTFGPRAFGPHRASAEPRAHPPQQAPPAA